MKRSPQGGFSLISILVALLLICALYLWFFGFVPSGLETAGRAVEARETSNAMACQMNRKAAEKALLTWGVTHPGEKPSIDELKASGDFILGCPDGGDYSVQGQTVVCSLH